MARDERPRWAVLWLVILGGCLAITGAFVGLVALGRWWKPAPYALIVLVGTAGLAWILVSDDGEDDRPDLL